tara:strand:+ start:590 stop:868 length:279 start_codon:yes stop_codon:yes gene_type:complete
LTKDTKIEPSFQFCWALSWRLILLSILIGILPVATATICIGVAGAAMPSTINLLLLVTANALIILASFSISLKILLSKNFKGSTIRFYQNNA